MFKCSVEIGDLVDVENGQEVTVYCAENYPPTVEATMDGTAEPWFTSEGIPVIGDETQEVEGKLSMELDLGEIRKNIDAIDDQLLELFKQRMGLTRKVAEYKAAHNMVVFQSEREKAIIRSVRDRSPEELKSSAEFLFTNIMDISKCGQNNAITPAVSIPHGTQIKHTPDVAVQGIEGAYGHAAAQKLFPDGRMNFRASFAEVFEAVENGSADYGVIPVENSTAGEVSVNMELLEKHHVFVNRTVTVPCTHVLAAKHGVKEQDIRILFGHEQAIRQCSEYASSRPELTIIPYANNAMAAQMVAENRSSELGCICSRECAEMHGLDIVNPAIAADPQQRDKILLHLKRDRGLRRRGHYRSVCFPAAYFGLPLQNADKIRGQRT